MGGGGGGGGVCGLYRSHRKTDRAPTVNIVIDFMKKTCSCKDG